MAMSIKTLLSPEIENATFNDHCVLSYKIQVKMWDPNLVEASVTR